MKLLVVAALIAAVASSPLTQSKTWPWQVGKEYIYDAHTYTSTNYDTSDSNGFSFKAQFVIRVLAPGHLIAKLSNPSYAQFQMAEPITDLDTSHDLKYQPIQVIDEPFEIFVEGGRVESFKIPSTLSVEKENLLKALISAIQVDLSSFGHDDSFPNTYDEETFQGLFKKMEADVTGECETLYSVSPVSAEWHRDLPKLPSVEDASEAIEIIKSKNYGSCKKHGALDFGVPEGFIWNGFAYENEEKQFIKRTSESSVFAGKQGTIFKSGVVNYVLASPLLVGKQKAQVSSAVQLLLSSVQDTSGAEWKKIETGRQVDSLLFAINETMFFPKRGEHNIASAEIMLQEMSSMLQTPSNLPKTDFLSKFNILVRVVSALRLEELKKLTNKVGIAKNPENATKGNMWIIFRDALAASGTGPAFELIRSWILSKQVQGEEAAEVISSIGASLRYPTEKITTEFYNFMTNPVVMEQQFVNNSALLAATKYFRFAKNDLFVVETVIPHLSKELKNAVKNEDSNKAQAYIRALGNLAHPEILKVYVPYLDGSVAVSKYLRIQIVASLKTLANMKDEHVRAALFRILKNTAEPYEVRVAAALNIFMAVPTAEMMQVMARMANYDLSVQVRAVLTNSLLFAADLKDPRFSQLAKAAQAVKDILPKEKFGYRYSTDSIIEEYTSDDDIAFFRELSYIGSEDSILPMYHRSALRDKSTGLTEENQITLSVSGVQQILDYIRQAIYKPKESKIDLKYSAKKIAEQLNIKRKPRESIEGALFLEDLNQQRLLTFTEEDLESFIGSTIKNVEQLLEGVNVQYTKILNSKQVYVVFPLITGVPFIFSFNEPLMYSAHGQVQINVDTDADDVVGSLKNTLDLTYARTIDSNVGFLDTFKDNYVLAGVTNKIQFHIPANINVKLAPGDIKLNFVLPEQDANLFHLSVTPYCTEQPVNSLLTVSENPSTKLIERQKRYLAFDGNLGESVGVSLFLKALSFSSDSEKSTPYVSGLLTTIGNFMYPSDVAFTEFDLNYYAKDTKNKDITFNAFYDKLFNQKKDGEFAPAAVIEDVTVNNEAARREELVKRAAAGIKSAQVQLYDLSMVFDGQKKVQYDFTAALANSFVDNKTQGAFFFKGCQQINAVFKLVKPKIVPLNFEEALKNKINVTYEVDFKYENFENIQIQGFAERSERYTESLLNDPLGKKCLKESSKNNTFQLDCYKMIIKAHTPDFFKATASYKELSPTYAHLANYIYDIVKDFYDWEVTENVFDKAEDGKVEIEIEAFYDSLFANYEFKSKYGSFRMNNVEGRAYYPYALAVYGPISSWERSYNWFTYYQHLPHCAVDYNKVWTFSGRSYDYSLTGSWHVVMVDESNDFGKWTDLVILARRPSDKQEEVYISYKTEDGNYVEVEIKPDAVQVNSNTKKVSDDALISYWDDSEEMPLLQYYTLADGILVFNIKDGAIRLVYDSERLVIFTDDHRSTTRGICGQSTSQARDDYMTPYGIVDSPEYYGASFSLEGEFSDPKTAELKKEAKSNAYQPVTRYTNILRSDAQWSKAKNQSPKEL